MLRSRIEECKVRHVGKNENCKTNDAEFQIYFNEINTNSMKNLNKDFKLLYCTY